MIKAAFFDRDGVINIDYGYVGTIDQFDFIPDIYLSLQELKKLGYFLVLVTNQSGVARGKYTESDVIRTNQFMQENLRLNDACFDAIYYCPHHPNAQILRYKLDCDCRKPKAGMFFKAAKEHDINLKESIMFGDHASDLIAAKSAGIEQLFLLGNHIKEEKEKISECICYKNMKDAVNFLKMKKSNDS